VFRDKPQQDVPIDTARLSNDSGLTATFNEIGQRLVQRRDRFSVGGSGGVEFALALLELILQRDVSLFEIGDLAL
jgi:hypothetical protein